MKYSRLFVDASFHCNYIVDDETPMCIQSNVGWRAGLSKHVMRSYADVLELIRRGMARHNLVNSLNATSRTQAHIVLVYTFTQVLCLTCSGHTWIRYSHLYGHHSSLVLADHGARICLHVYQYDVITVCLCLRLIISKTLISNNWQQRIDVDMY